MSALEIVHLTGKGRHHNCQEPRPSGARCLLSASARVSILGHPPVRMCPRHANEAQTIWERALAGFPDEEGAR